MCTATFIALLTAPVAAVASVLSLNGEQPAVEFGPAGSTRAVLTASCTAPPSTAEPAVHRMKPTLFAPLSDGAAVRLRLSGVAISCSGLRGAAPCVIPFDELDEARWYCVWSSEASAGTAVVGPLHGNVSFNPAHSQYPSATSAPCTAAQTMHPVLECPLPGDEAIGQLLPSLPAALKLAVRFFAPAGVHAVDLPFVDIANEEKRSRSSTTTDRG